MRYLLVAASFVGACIPADLQQNEPLEVNCSKRVGIPDHTPEYVKGVVLGDRLGDEHRLELRVVLQLRNLDQLNTFLANMTIAGRPGWGVPMSPQRFAQDHLPTAEQAKAAIASLVRHGLQVADAPVGALLHASGTPSQVRAAFGTAIRRDGTDGGYLPDGEPQMPDPVIRGIGGLAEHLPARTWTSPIAQPSEQPLIPDRIRQAYSIPPELRGKGQTLAVVGLDGFESSDIAAYAAAHKQRQVPIMPILLADWDGKPRSLSGQTETTMDLQLLSAVAPEADAIYAVLADPRSEHGLLDALNWLANPPADTPQVRHISCSWGIPESGVSQAAIQVMETVIKQLAVTGTSLHVASGDLGAFDAGGTAKVVDSPASSRWAHAVGGTTLRLGPPRVETTWPGSGGGYSCFWPAPSWQGMAWGQPELAAMRALPDVALAADPATPYAAIIRSQPKAVAGTSAAAPVMAGIAALLDEARQKAGKGPLGFLPPQLYHASCQGADNGFHDIVDGDNGGFAAAKGADAATGLGAPDVATLTHLLTK